MTTTSRRPARPGAHGRPARRDGSTRVRSFARSMTSTSMLTHPRDDTDWGHLLTPGSGRGPTVRGLTVRGLGASYSDAALNSGGTVAVTTTGARGVGAVSPDGIVDVDAGVRIADLLAACIPQGWLPPVLPGTAGVTVGGAVASDVHGKNHLHRGSFGDHVWEMDLLTPGGGPAVIGPSCDPDTFWATVGGLGLTGVIRRLRLQLVPIDSSWFVTRDVACRDLDELLERMVMSAPSSEHVVAWVDGHATGPATGRGVVSTATWLSAAELPAAHAARPLAYQVGSRRRVPGATVNLVRPGLVRTANATRYARAVRQTGERVRDVSQTLHPLDTVADWPALYGRKGLLQYQFAVPDGGEHVIAHVLRRLQVVGCPPSLVVVKRFGEGTSGHLSFPMPGWTVALDLPVRTGSEPSRCLDGVDDVVLAARGRVYLVKDSRMHHDLVREMFPRLDEWRTVRDRLDPAGVMTSDMDRRLWLTGHHGGRR